MESPSPNKCKVSDESFKKADTSVSSPMFPKGNMLSGDISAIVQENKPAFEWSDNLNKGNRSQSIG